MDFLATFEPGEDSPHWFVLDRAIIGRAWPGADRTGARRGVFAAPDEEEILEASATACSGTATGRRSRETTRR